MSVYAVNRVAPESPTGTMVKVFPEASVLDWFRAHWRGIEDEKAAFRYTEALLGTQSDLSMLWLLIAEEGVPRPRTAAQLGRYLQDFLETDGLILYDPHCVQMLEAYVDAQREVFLFDDHYLARHQDRAALLLRPTWALPTDVGDGGFTPDVQAHNLTPAGRSAGTTYLAFVDRANDTDVLLLPGGCQVRGVRLPELARHLVRATPDKKWPLDLLLVRAQLLAVPKGTGRAENAFLRRLREHPADDDAWEAYSGWLAGRGVGRAESVLLSRALGEASRYNAAYFRGDVDPSALVPGLLRPAAEAQASLPGLPKRRSAPAQFRLNVGEHLLQLVRHDRYARKVAHLQEWFLFDDLWAGRHAALANAALRAAARWDVLS